MWIYLCAVLVVVILIANYGTSKQRRLRAFAKTLPGPLSLPIIGCAYIFMKNGGDYLLETITEFRKYTSPMKLWVGNNLIIVVTKPDQTEKILRSTRIADKHHFYDFMKPCMGEGLISGSGKKWKSARKLIQPSFNNSFVAECVEIFQAHDTALMKELESNADKGFFNVEPIIHKCTMDTIAESILGVKFRTQEGHNKELQRTFNNFYDGAIVRMLRPWLHSDFIFNLTSRKKVQDETASFLQNFFNKIVAKGKEAYNNNAPLDVTMEYNGFVPPIVEICGKFSTTTEDLDDDDLRDNITTLYAASEDTITAVAAAACVCFGMYPEYQEKAFEELYNVLGDVEIITVDAIAKLTYLDMCVKEALRLFPIAPVIIRNVTEDFDLGNHCLPKGCAVMLGIFNLHLNSDEWEHPMDFHPDHFLPEAVEKRHHYSFIPFSSGPRGCIGKTFAQTSIKLLLANILRRFEIEATGKYRDIYATFRADISVRPSVGYQIKLKRRRVHN